MIRTRARIAKIEAMKLITLRQVQKGFEGKSRVEIIAQTGMADSQISELKNGKMHNFSLVRLLMLADIFGFEAKIGFTG